MSDVYPGDAICGIHDVIMVSCNYRLGPFGKFHFVLILVNCELQMTQHTSGLNDTDLI